MSKSTKLSYNFLLLGKTGAGKSATGNTLLDRKDCFKTSNFFKSCTKNAVKESNEFMEFFFHVVDTPGIHDTENEQPKTLAVIYEGVSLIPNGFNAMLLVMRMDDRFTKEMIETVNALKVSFGDSDFMKFCIIVFTHGDSAPELNNDNIQQWCQDKENIKEGSELHKLMITCDYRVALFDNRNDGKREDSVNKLLSYIDPQAPRYTSDLFKQCAKGRDDYVTSLGFPAQREKIQTELSLLTAALGQEVEKLKKHKESNVDQISTRIDCLIKTIETESHGTESMDDLMIRALDLKSRINNLPKDPKERIEELMLMLAAVTALKIAGVVSSFVAVASGVTLAVNVVMTCTKAITLASGIAAGIPLAVLTLGSTAVAIFLFALDSK